MFSGIVEELGSVISTEERAGNIHFKIHCSFIHELEIDQSIAHNGICLTIDELNKDYYGVTAIEETLNLTNMRHCKAGDLLNLERALKVNARIDGHFVQGHVDTIATLERIEHKEGSHLFTFKHSEHPVYIHIRKGSVCVNGVSLTVIGPTSNRFSVAIIPYTFEHTNLKLLGIGDQVNIEYDMLGKYITELQYRMHNTIHGG